jgi:four helix bundle protein
LILSAISLSRGWPLTQQCLALFHYDPGRLFVVQDFRQLKVWEKAHQLALALYRVTAAFPHQELHGLTSQMRRAASSIPSNIAEGCGRDGDAELARFCTIARGSASELEYHLLLARDLKLIQTNDYEQLAQQTTEIKRMLTVFVQKLTAER